MKRFISSLIAVALAVTTLAGMGSSAKAAGGATFSLTPVSSTININTVFGITIFENGTDVNVVTADLVYDASKLEFVSIDTSASAFPNTVNGSGNGGSVSLSRYTSPGATLNGSQKVAVVNFRAIVGSGSTGVAFASSSKIASNGVDIWDHAPVSAAYTLTAPEPVPATTPAPIQTPTPSAGVVAVASQSSQPGPATSSTQRSGVSLAAADNPGSFTEQQVAGATTDRDDATPTATKSDRKLLGAPQVGIIIIVTLLSAAVIVVRRLAGVREPATLRAVSAAVKKRPVVARNPAKRYTKKKSATSARIVK